MHIAVQDIATAFDALEHEPISACLLEMGMHPANVLSLMQELAGVKGRISILGAGTSEQFPFCKGGKQGGVDTPDIFNAMIEAAFAPMVRSWSARGIGIVLDGTLFNHCWWADNLWLFAKSRTELAILCQESTAVVYNLRLTWKPSSLVTMHSDGCRTDSLQELSVTSPTGDTLDYKVVESIDCLGTLLEKSGCSYASMHHRMSKAEKHFWAHSKAFMGPGSVWA